LNLEKLRDRFSAAKAEQKNHVIKNSVEPLASLDYSKEDYSVIIDHRWSKVENKKLLKLVYWYDNEWAYSSKVVDIVKMTSNYY
jgi:glyceraldehyde 3-phosphate dehydrogenase